MTTFKYNTANYQPKSFDFGYVRCVLEDLYE